MTEFDLFVLCDAVPMLMRGPTIDPELESARRAMWGKDRVEIEFEFQLAFNQIVLGMAPVDINALPIDMIDRIIHAGAASPPFDLESFFPLSPAFKARSTHRQRDGPSLHAGGCAGLAQQGKRASGVLCWDSVSA